MSKVIILAICLLAVAVAADHSSHGRITECDRCPRGRQIDREQCHCKPKPDECHCKPKPDECEQHKSCHPKPEPPTPTPQVSTQANYFLEVNNPDSLLFEGENILRILRLDPSIYPSSPDFTLSADGTTLTANFDGRLSFIGQLQLQTRSMLDAELAASKFVLADAVYVGLAVKSTDGVPDADKKAIVSLLQARDLDHYATVSYQAIFDVTAGKSIQFTTRVEMKTKVTPLQTDGTVAKLLARVYGGNNIAYSPMVANFERAKEAVIA